MHSTQTGQDTEKQSDIYTQSIQKQVLDRKCEDQYLSQCWRSQQKPGKMARTRTRMFLALVLLGIFSLGVSVKGELQGEQQEEEERSCQGAFDLYFVLDK